MVSFRLKIPDTPTVLDRVPKPLMALGWLWSSPITVLTLLVVLLTGGLPAWRSLRLVDRFLECVPGGLPHWWFKATRTGGSAWGSLVLFRSRAAQCSPNLRQHEARHVWWYWILGPLWLPVYGLDSIWDALRGQGWYRNNWMEQDAREAEKEPDE